ncbi:MAG: hypothetical protein HYU64_11030 [Armatimonadetes bacterium]|nr:hypothetical protein [Armatimonadota bacterium]
MRAISQDSYRETSQEQVLDPRFLEKALKSEDYIADGIGFGLSLMFYGLIGCAFGAGAGAVGGAALANALGGSTLAVVLSGVGGGVAGAVVGGGIGATIASRQQF